jgi:hypothetical protein
MVDILYTLSVCFAYSEAKSFPAGDSKMNAQANLDVVAQALPSDDAKFTDALVNNELCEAAQAWVSEYTGDFQYLVDMRRDFQNFGSLSTGKARGVLNCMRNEILKAQKTSAPTSTPTSTFPLGLNRYCIEIDGRERFFSINQPTKGKWEGYLFLDELFGAPGDFRKNPIKGNHKAEVLSLLGNDSDALARFGWKFQVCGMCASPLTDATSRELGIGPVCMGKLNS